MVLDKNKLLTDGYLAFNLKDVDVELYNELQNTIDKVDLIKQIKCFRTDFQYLDGSLTEDNYKQIGDKFIESLKINNELDFVNSNQTVYKLNMDENPDRRLLSFNLKIYSHNLEYLKEVQTNLFKHKNLNIFQSWYSSTGVDSYENYFSCIKKIYRKLVKETYIEEIKNQNKWSDDDIVWGTDLTLYIKNNHILNHHDGNDIGRLCVVLIYLNNDYETGFGGEIVVNNEITITPEFGNIVILDFTQHNLDHSVNMVLDDNFNRLAFIKFFYE